MSDSFLRLIPTDPRWVPTAAQTEQALNLLRSLRPPDDYEPETFEQIVFVDQGENFVEVRCPFYRSTITHEWFLDQMDRPSFDDLLTATPCCGVTVSLNDLDYDWPAGFARFSLSVMNPENPELSRDELDQVERALGHQIRQILARY